MSPFENYFIISTVYLTVFYLFYLQFLSKDTQYRRNRIYLIGSVIISMVLPLIRIQYKGSSAFGGFTNSLNDILPLGQANIINNQFTEATFSFSYVLLLIYSIGVIIASALLIYNTYRLVNRISKNRNPGSKILLSSSCQGAGFSAFGYIFINRNLNDEEKQRVTEHELKHIEKNHFIDLLLLRFLSVFMWFNPVIYLYERSIMAIHEYEVDKDMLKNGENIISYQKLILNQIFKTRFFTLQNSFSGNSLIKKRIIMMTKRRSRKLSGIKLLLITPVILVLFTIFSCRNEKTEIPANDEAKQAEFNEQEAIKTESSADYQEKSEGEEQVFNVVEDPPTFLGGNINKFRDWVQVNVKYPREAVDKGESGKVFITFIIEKDGSVSEATIIRGVSESLDKESLRVVNSSPLWKAGKQRGVEVRVRFSITVNFQLSKP